LRIYDVAGRLVRNLVDETSPAGTGQVLWDGRDRTGKPAPGGLYFYRLETSEETRTRKLLLVR
jgi:flagellar hook assembly protein FlgD